MGRKPIESDITASGADVVGVCPACYISGGMGGLVGTTKFEQKKLLVVVGVVPRQKARNVAVLVEQKFVDDLRQGGLVKDALL